MLIEEANASLEVEAFLAATLGDDTELIALHDGHVHPVFLPSTVSLAAYVGITYRRSGTTRAMTLQQATGNATARFELSIWGNSDTQGYLRACRAARLVRLKLNGVTTQTPEGHFIEAIRVVDESDDQDLAVLDDEVVALRRVLTIEIDHQEPARLAIGG